MHARGGAGILPPRRSHRYLLHTETDGTVTGYASYRMKESWTETGHPDGTLTAPPAAPVALAASYAVAVIVCVPTAGVQA